MSDVSPTSERDLWIAELDLMGEAHPAARSVQFAIRTAVRAQQLARLAGTDAVDELLDARGSVAATSTKRVFDRAVYYVRTDRALTRDMRAVGLEDTFGL